MKRVPPRPLAKLRLPLRTARAAREDSLHVNELDLVGAPRDGQEALVQAEFGSQDAARVYELEAEQVRKSGRG